jgi:hypothetical protein
VGSGVRWSEAGRRLRVSSIKGEKFGSTSMAALPTLKKGGDRMFKGRFWKDKAFWEAFTKYSITILQVLIESGVIKTNGKVKKNRRK